MPGEDRPQTLYSSGTLPTPVFDACRKPTLQIKCSGAGSAALTLRLMPTCVPQMLQLRKLSPDANAVRTISSQPAATYPNSAATAQTEQSGASTPHYNSSILQVCQCV
jgi:Nrap protein domain 1